MIYLLLIITFAYLSLAADDGSESPGPINRWIELHGKIYNNSSVSSRIKLAELKAIIEELSSIEQTDAYKSGLRPLIESGAFRINRYGRLVDEAYETNVLMNKDASISNLFEQIFDYDANDCTDEYFQQMGDIYQNFRNGPIGPALEESHELQYKNCWDRYTTSLKATYMLLGSRLRSNLEKIVPNLYPNFHGPIIDLSLNPTSTDYVGQSDEIIKNISRFVKGKDGAEQKIATLKRYVQQPCSLFLNSASQVMCNVLKRLYSSNMTDQLLSEHAQILNTFILCYRIQSDEKLINLSFHSPSDFNGLKVTDARIDEPENAPDTTDVNSQNFSILNSFRGENLITQHPLDFPERGDQLAPIEPIDESSCEKEAKWLVSVDKSIHRGKSTKYICTWSDGSITKEIKSYLKECWPAQFELLMRRMRSRNKANFLMRHRFPEANLNSGPLIQEINSDLRHGDKWLVGVGRSISRGRHARYPSTWSDGTVTLETKAYLEEKWRIQHEIKTNRMLREKKARYCKRSRAAKKLAPEKSIELPDQSTQPPIKKRRLADPQDVSTSSHLRQTNDVTSDETQIYPNVPNVELSIGLGSQGLHTNSSRESDKTHSS